MRTRLFWLVPLMVALLVSGCGPGAADYDFKVAGGYELSRYSGHQVQVQLVGRGTIDPAHMIPPKVTKLAWNDRYVVAEQEELKRRNPNNPDCDGNRDTLPADRQDALGYDCYEEPSGVLHYWILDTIIKQTFGPYDQPAFDAKRQALGIPDGLKMKAPTDYIHDLCRGDRSAANCQQ